MVNVVTDQNFNEQVETQKGITMVDFWAEWCGPCRQLSPTIEAISDEYKAIKVFKMDVDANPQTPSRFHIRGIPTVIFFKDGQPVDQLVGNHPKDRIIASLQKLTSGAST